MAWEERGPLVNPFPSGLLLSPRARYSLPGVFVAGLARAGTYNRRFPGFETGTHRPGPKVHWTPYRHSLMSYFFPVSARVTRVLNST